MSKRSAAWNYFEKRNNAEAKCMKCGSVLNCKGSTTSALVNHLRLRHDINLSKQSDIHDNVDPEVDPEQGPSVTPKQKKTEQTSMQQFVKKKV